MTAKNIFAGILFAALVFASVIFAVPADAARKIVIEKQNYEGQNIVEILKLDDNADADVQNNVAAIEFNRAVDASVGKFYEEFRARLAEYPDAAEDEWVEILSYPFSSENFLQVVTVYEEYPHTGSDGNIRSFNYDRKNNKFVTVSEILKANGYTERSLTERVKKWFGPANGEKAILDVAPRGFVVLGDDVQILMEVEISTPDAGSGSRTGFYGLWIGADKQEQGEPFGRLYRKTLFDPALVDDMGLMINGG